MLLLANLAATWTMVGVIWTIQIVHYPLFDRVGAAGFPRYAADHNALITLVVGPTMLLEAATTALLLLAWPTELPGWMPWVGAALLAIIWGATAFLSVPQHTILGAGFDEAAYRALVGTNWVRTIAWTLRGALMLWAVGLLIR